MDTDKYQDFTCRQAIQTLFGSLVGGGVWEIRPQSAWPVVGVQISCHSAEARMVVVVVVGVSRVEMYSNVNLHLKRLAVAHAGGDWSFSGILALSASLGKMKVEMDGAEKQRKSYGSSKKGGSRDSLDELKEVYVATSCKAIFNVPFPV